MSRVQLELPNDVAAELAGPGDLVMKTLEGHLDCEVFLRGNVLTLDGDEDAVAMGRTVVRELTDLVRQGHEIAPGTIEAIAGALDQHESPSRILEDVVWRHRSLKVAPKTVNQKRYVDAIRRQTITVGVGPAGTGKSFLAVAMAGPRCRAVRSAASCSPGPRWKRASASASCPATSPPRSTLTCAPCSTPSTTCSSPRRSTSIWSAG